MEDDAEHWKGPAKGIDGSAEVVRGRRYLPFGDGMRSCVGQSLAKMNYTATLALLLSHFSFRLADRVSACATVVFPVPKVALLADPYKPGQGTVWPLAVPQISIPLGIV